MRRVGELWPRVVAVDNLRTATRRAARGKRDQAQVTRFLLEREPQLLGLECELVAQTYRPGRLARFVIHDSKTRVISVAPFRDRVVHHSPH